MFYRGTEITPKELFSVFKVNALESRKMTRGIRELIFFFLIKSLVEPSAFLNHL